MSWWRFVGTTTRRYAQKRLTKQESLLPLSKGTLRAFSTWRTFEKLQWCSLLSLLLPSPPEQPFTTRPLFLLLKSPKGLARLVTKARRLRWPRARRLARMDHGPKTRARARRSSPCQWQKVHPKDDPSLAKA